MASQLLTLYWVLVHDDATHAALDEKAKRGVKTTLRPYSRYAPSILHALASCLTTAALHSDLTDAIPIKSLLRHAESAPEAYAVLLPVLHSLLVAQYPQLFSLAPLLMEEEARLKCVLLSARSLMCFVNPRLSNAAPPPLLLSTHAASGMEVAATDPLASLPGLLASPLDATRAPQLALALQALAQLKPESVAPHIDSVLDSLLPALLDPTYALAHSSHTR